MEDAAFPVGNTELVLAASGGILSFLSPCGIPIIPGYIPYYLGNEASFGRSLWGGLTAMTGIVLTVFGLGSMAAVSLNFLNSSLGYLGIAGGSTIIALGIVTLLGIKIPKVQAVVKAPAKKGVAGFFVFGILYSIISLACVPTFLISIVLTGLFLPLSDAIFLLSLFAVSMGFPILMMSLLISEAKAAFLSRLMKMLPAIQKFGGLLLIGGGAYQLYFFLFEEKRFLG